MKAKKYLVLTDIQFINIYIYIYIYTYGIYIYIFFNGFY